MVYTADLLTWTQEASSQLARFLAAQCRPPSTEPMAEWWERNIVLDSSGPFPGPFRCDLTPIIRLLAEWAQNRRIHRIVGMGAAQTIKTQFLLNLINWSINESPGTTMWIMADADGSREFWTKRLEPAIEHCAPTKARFCAKAKDLVSFDSMNLLLRGSNSRAKLQSDPVKRLICDERREWKKGSIDLVRKRTRTFAEAQEFSFGTAGHEFDELHTDYLEGSQTMPHFRCLQCGHSQPFRFGRVPSALFPNARERGGVVWEKNDTTCPGGIWDFAELRKTVRYECEQCAHRYRNDEKYLLVRTIHPHDYNPAAAPDKKSIHWSALEFLWDKCDWAELAEEFLRAVAAAKLGNIEPLKGFVSETTGEPWQDQLGVIEDFSFLDQRRADYDFGEPWAEETARFMAADRQSAGGEHYWWVIRAFGPFGKSRLVAYGRCTSTLELDTIRRQYNVTTRNAMLDSGYKANEVYRFCASTGWKPFKGDGNEYFLVHDDRTKKTVRQCWQVSWAQPEGVRPQPGIQKRVRLFRWSNSWVKDLLAEFTTGLVGEWTLPRAVGRDYLKQMSAERREEFTDPKGRVRYEWVQKMRDNHLFDCELMLLTAAVITRLVAGGALTSRTSRLT